MRSTTQISRMGLLLLLAAGLYGCGGGSKSVAGAARTGGKGKLTVTFKWPTAAKAAQRHRFIPLASMSVVVTVNGPTGFAATSPPLTPSGSGSGAISTYTFNNVPTGAIAVSSVAYPNPDGTGTAQAIATNPNVTIQANQTANLILTMDTTIDNGHTSISGPGQLTRTRAANYTVTFQDSNGNTVLVDPSTVTWDTDDHTIALVTSVDPTTHLTAAISGISARSTNIRATYQEPGQAAQFPNNPNRQGTFGIQIVPVIYLCDHDNNNVVEIDNLNGDNRTTLPPSGASYAFNQPSGIAVDSVGGVYVADTGNNRVVRVKTDGTGFTSLTNANGTALSNPTAVTVDLSDNIYIVDNGNNRILTCTYDPQGNAVNFSNEIPINSALAHNGIGILGFTDPVFTEDPIASVGTPAVTLFDGSNFSTFAGQGVVVLKFPWGVATRPFDPSNLFVADRDGNQVLQFTGQNNNNGVLNFDTITVASKLDTFNGIPLSAPHALATDGYNNLYIADTGNHRLVQTTITFGLAVFANSFTYTPSGGNALAGVYGVAVDQPVAPRF